MFFSWFRFLLEMLPNSFASSKKKTENNNNVFSFRAIYFGAYDTAKSMFDSPNILTKFAIAQVRHVLDGLMTV